MPKGHSDILTYTPAALSDTAAEAMASFTAQKLRAEQQSYNMMTSMARMGATTGVAGKVNHVAKLFCISFAMIAPNLLFIKYVL